MTSYQKSGIEITVNNEVSGMQQKPALARLANGTLVAVWESSTGEDVKGRLLAADGTAIGTEFLVNTATADNQTTPAVTGLAGGGFVVTWATSDIAQDGSKDAVKAQLFDAAGTKLGGEFLVNTQTANIQWNPAITALDSGGFVIAWDTWDPLQDGSGRSVKAQIYDAAGARLGAEFLVNTEAFNSQGFCDVTTLSGGRFIVTWATVGSTSALSWELRGQLFDAAGNKLGGEILVNTQTTNAQYENEVTTLANGGFVVTWTTEDAAQDGSGYAIKAQLFSSAGVKVGAELLVNTAVAGSQRSPTVAGLSNGDFVIAWRTDDPTADDAMGAIKAQVFTSAGVKSGGEFLVNASGGGSPETNPVVIDLGNGSFAIGWTGGSLDIMMQVFSAQAAPVITSNGGGDSAATSVAENSNAVTTVIAGSGPGIVYAITGGADAARFVINSTTGALSFGTAPNFEVRNDANGDGVYQVMVSASRGGSSDSQLLAVTVTNVNEGLNFNGGPSSFSYLENGTAAVATILAVDLDGTAVAYSLTGADAAHFTISAAGVLAFAAAPDFEAAADAGGNHVYNVSVVASDGTFAISRPLTVQLLNQNEAPVIVSNGGGAAAGIAASENGTAVTTVLANDVDSGVTYAIAGGADAALFTIDAATGALAFIAAPDFEAPGDADGDNVYQVVVRASDGSLSDTQALSVSVTDVAEYAPFALAATAFAVDENTSAPAWLEVTGGAGVGPIHYAITGGADGQQFWVDELTGELNLEPWDFEAPVDQDGDNVYEVEITAGQGADVATGLVTVTLGDVDEAPVFLPGEGFLLVTLAENSLEVAALSAFDPGGPVRL